MNNINTTAAQIETYKNELDQMKKDRNQIWNERGNIGHFRNGMGIFENRKNGIGKVRFEGMTQMIEKMDSEISIMETKIFMLMTGFSN